MSGLIRNKPQELRDLYKQNWFDSYVLYDEPSRALEWLVLFGCYGVPGFILGYGLHLHDALIPMFYIYIGSYFFMEFGVKQLFVACILRSNDESASQDILDTIEDDFSKIGLMPLFGIFVGNILAMAWFALLPYTLSLLSLWSGVL